MNTIRIHLDDITTALNDLNKVKKELQEKNRRFLEEMARRGAEKATEHFSTAIYDGTNDVEVTQELRSDTQAAVVADGNATLFIEFGSGITYPNDHPEAAELGMIHGEYGYKLGRNPNGWRYAGDPGSNGEIITEGKHAGMIKTYGNPANMCMYLTVRELEQECAEVAREVFK